MKLWTAVVGTVALALTACGGAKEPDARNGTYRVFATDGYSHTLTVDFDAGTYAMSGNGVDASGPFTSDGAGTYTISGNAKFRVAPDLLVGGFDFGNGVKAFVAARRFVSSLDELSGDLNTFRLNLPHGGSPDSLIYAVRFASGTYQVCSDTLIYSVANCPAASLWTYTLSIAGEVITGTDSVHSDTMGFRVAKTGSTLVFLRASANAANTAQRFMIALPEASGLAGGTFLGSSTAGSWGTTTLTGTQYSRAAVASGGGALTDSASLTAMVNAPQGIVIGPRTSDGANVFVMQSGPLAVLIGARGGPAVGYLELAAP